VQYVGQGEEDFAVSDADVILHLHVGGLGEIGGAVLWDGSPRAPSDRVLFRIESEEGAMQGVRVDALGHFHVSRVLPGKYRFKALSAAPVAVLRSVQCEGKEVRDDLPLQIGDHGKVLDCKVTLATP
jgi:hypothetical protein